MAGSSRGRRGASLTGARVYRQVAPACLTRPERLQNGSYQGLFHALQQNVFGQIDTNKYQFACLDFLRTP